MEFNVSQQLKSPVGTARNYDVSGTIEIEGYDAHVRGKVSLMRTDRSILVKGKIVTDSELSCSRCLSSLNCRTEFNVEEEYFPSTDILNGMPLPEPDDPGSFTIDEHNILDLTEAVRQYTALNRTMKPLCDDDCSGLCPVCGINMNLSSCDCPKGIIDPRWEKLAKLTQTDAKATVMEMKGRE